MQQSPVPTRELARVLLHRGETTWQQQESVAAKPRPKRPPEHASGAKRRAAHRHARARASAGSWYRIRQKKAGGHRRLFFFIVSSEQLPAPRFARSAPDTLVR